MILVDHLGLLWLSTVPLTSGLVSDMFSPKYGSTLFGIAFASHQLGSFFGAWAGGRIYDATGSYDIFWWVGVAFGLAAAVEHWPIVGKRVDLQALKLKRAEGKGAEFLSKGGAAGALRGFSAQCGWLSASFWFVRAQWSAVGAGAV